MSEREQKLEAIVRRLMPAVRDVMWIACVWNDYNFGETDIRNKAIDACEKLGIDTSKTSLGDAVDHANKFLEHVQEVLNG